MANFNNKPKFSFDLGLNFMRDLTPTSKVKVYRTYLNHLDDLQLLGAILKKSVNRCSSLGLITKNVYDKFREIFDAFEKEFTVKNLREVDFIEIEESEVILPKLRRFINLLGCQSSNSQVTFNHRYIINETEIGVVAEIAIAAINHAGEAYIINPEFAMRMNRDIIDIMENSERVEDDPDYNRFDTPEQDDEDTEINYNRRDFTPEQDYGNEY